MYLGIDLGTSNSAVVGSDGGTLRLFKTVEGMDVMPSAIMVDRRGAMFVGRKAYDQSAYSPQNVALRFKRLMGTGSAIDFPGSGHRLTPEEASAEVIKALVAQARTDLPDAVIDGTVVTIPAAFNQMQSEATMRAAKLAGLDHVALLQEPIAAAMAAIAESGEPASQFLIYDLGGGTFDAAIVQNIAGNVTVVGHAGVNMLGGADFDRAIVSSLVRPWLVQNFNLPADFQTRPEYARLMRIAHYRAELSKIAISTQQVDQIFADENQVGTRDADGREIYLDVELRRTDLEGLISVSIDRSIEECRKLLATTGFSPSDMNRIVLIGGPSRMPYVRERVGFELGVEVDTSIDPMTAVAKGAAIYSSGRAWASSGEIGSSTVRETADVESDLGLSLDYQNNQAAPEVRIRIKSSRTSSTLSGYTVQVSTENGWTSGKLPLSPLVDIKGVPLPKVGANQVQMEVFGVDGRRDEGSSGVLTITRLAATSDGMPLMHGLAISVVSGSPGLQKNVLEELAKKGSSTPASGMKSFRAARDLRSGEKEALSFELFEKAEGVDDPALNLAVGSFQLRGDALAPGQVIRRGDTVNVHWKIDASSLLHCHFVIPDLSLEYSLENMYVSTSSAANFDGDEGSLLATGSLSDARSDLEHIERALGAKITAKSQPLRQKLDDQATALAMAGDADTRRRVSEEARFLRQEIYRLKHEEENIVAVQQIELDDFATDYSTYFAKEIDADTHTKVTRQIASARDALARGDWNDARLAQDEARALLSAYMVKQPGFWASWFDRMIDERFNAADKGLHDRLAQRGQQALKSNNLEELKQVVAQMSQNMVRSNAGVDLSVLSGLMR